MATNNSINLKGPIPAFSAYLGAPDVDVTGDSTVFVLGSGNALTEIYDYTNSFVTTGTFTAPISGLYQFNICSLFQDVSAAMGLVVTLVTTKRTYTYGNNAASFAGNNAISFSTLADMDATDTAYIQLAATGGTKTVDIYGGADARTFFNGFLIFKI